MSVGNMLIISVRLISDLQKVQLLNVDDHILWNGNVYYVIDANFTEDGNVKVELGAISQGVKQTNSIIVPKDFMVQIVSVIPLKEEKCNG